MHMFVRMCGCSALCVHRLSTWSRLPGLPGWHRDHLVRAHRAPLRRWSRAGWEWLMGQRSDTLRGSASDPQPALLLRCHPTQAAQWQRCLYAHTQHPPPSVTYPTHPLCHFPLVPPKSIKELCTGGISSFGWCHPPCCAVDTGVFLLEDKGDNWQLDQL